MGQKVLHRDKVLFEFPKAVTASCSEQEIGGQKAIISSKSQTVCILPGFDPRGQIGKKCQDMSLAAIEADTLMAFIFDGHGKTGHSVVSFCKSHSTHFFASNKELALSDPHRFLLDLASSLDSQLRTGTEGIDASYSGTTAVGLLIVGGQVCCAGVGDSRAVLGTAKPPLISYAEQPGRGDDKLILQSVMRRRSVQVDHPLVAVQLTKDQKPEDPIELDRILHSGGVVRRLMDEGGRNIGPWRVWKKDTNFPGLAMSRSIGDAVGKDIGVISTPHLSTHKMQEEDAFIVLASDGVWDVMENSEVIDFVEAYRHHCKRGCYTREPMDELTRPANSPVAQLLCEEARMRWLAIVEEEDVVIDDISCLVIELSDSTVHIVQPPDRSSVPNMDAADAPNLPEAMSIPASAVKLRDPRRASVSDD